MLSVSIGALETILLYFKKNIILQQLCSIELKNDFRLEIVLMISKDGKDFKIESVFRYNWFFNFRFFMKF